MASDSSANGPLDGLFRDTNKIILVLFGFCCGEIALILSLIGFLTAKDAQAKNNAQLVLIISVVLVALHVLGYATMGAGLLFHR